MEVPGTAGNGPHGPIRVVCSLARHMQLATGMRVSIAYLCLLLIACGSATESTDDTGADAGTAGLCTSDTADLVRPDWWSAASHCKGADPAYDYLFDDTVVRRLDITVSPDNYRATMDDLEATIGNRGGPPTTEQEPMWVPVTVAYEGYQWTEVGMRYKGNSSLRGAWRAGQRKLAFRLDFDEYEADHPALDDQRFFGFKKMTFGNNFNDFSLIREKVANEIFRAGGIPVARTTFVRVHVDFGEGPVYFGLYTMIEDPSNKMLEDQFGDDTGNLYKPEGDRSNWTMFDAALFPKKTNEDAADYSDIQATITALNGSRSDAAAWRAGLEATFDVRGFVRWLALNQAMVNWDTYGWIAHNYYVYGDPAQGGRLVWIPWDLNGSLRVRDTSGPWQGSDSVLLDNIGPQWPLIRFVLDDAVYAQLYRDELQAALDGPVGEASVIAMMRRYHDLVAPYVVGAAGEVAPYTFLPDSGAFEESLVSGSSALEPHVITRRQTVVDALR